MDSDFQTKVNMENSKKYFFAGAPNFFRTIATTAKS